MINIKTDAFIPHRRVRVTDESGLDLLLLDPEHHETRHLFRVQEEVSPFDEIHCQDRSFHDPVFRGPLFDLSRSIKPLPWPL